MGGDDMLKDRLRLILLEQARVGEPATYRELVDRLGLTPPQTIQRIAQALEILMAEDVTASRPLLAALCVSRTQHGLPARGFFVTAKVLGVFSGELGGLEARGFHEKELQYAFAYYGRSTT